MDINKKRGHVEALKFGTRVQIRNQKGELEFDTHNILTLGGRIKALESVFQNGFVAKNHLSLDSNLTTQKGGLSVITNPTITSCPDTSVAADYYNRPTTYFCIGNGGVNVEFPLAMAEPRNYETRLYGMVPFRCVPIANDLSPAERSVYRMRRLEIINGASYFTYYLKKFNPGLLNLVKSDNTDYTPVFADSNAIPPSSSGSSGSLTALSIHSFYEFNLDIEALEFKEYYKAINNGTLTNARLTEFGLVTAKELTGVSDNATVPQVYDEVCNAELFSKVVHSPTYMDQEENAKRITYTIFS